MRLFNLEIFEGHPIIYDNENTLLIDTGAPSTIHESSTLTFLAKKHNVASNFMGLNIKGISELLGKKITTLLGADIISQYKILLDYQKKVIVFDKNEIDFQGNEIEIATFMGIPVIELFVNHQSLKFFLDTGAKLSYLPANITDKYEITGREKDFYPGLGSFETNCYSIDTTVGKDSFKVRYGNLPRILQMTLMLGGTDGIIGSDFFNTFSLMLDLKNKKLKYNQYIP